jgi:predicted Zn-dependent protease
MKITPNQFAWIFVLVLVGLIGWGGYAAWKFFQHPADTVLSISNEMKLGEMIAERVMLEHGEETKVNIPYADSCLREIHQRLTNAMGKSEYDYKITLLKSPEPNAFAIPGGQVFVYSGLIQFCETPEELAAVMAHEMGHVERRHTVNGLIKQIGVGALLSYLGDGSGGVSQQIGEQMINGFFSREDEAEADDFALNLLEKARIRPAVLGEVFSRMKDEHGDMEGIMNLLSTHPELEQRSVKSKAYQTQSDFQELPLNLNWQKLQAAF